jgi:RNA polymerase sigma-70 factor (ECF subfamily)
MDSAQRHLIISPRMNYESTARYDELVLAAKAGSHAAFGELEKIYSHRLYKRILSITRSHEDTEDALQDTFFRAFAALPSFQGRSKFSTWLTRIAINSALMTLRKHRSRPETSFDQRQDLEDDMPVFDVSDNRLNPEQLCDLNQQFSAVLRAVEQLDPKLRTPIHILMAEKRSVKEIAHHLRISVASVKARLHRARKRLRDPIVFQSQLPADSMSQFSYSASRNLRAKRRDSRSIQQEACRQQD